MIQWLGLCAFTAEGPDSIPGGGSKIPQVMVWQKKEENNNRHNPESVSSHEALEDTEK